MVTVAQVDAWLDAKEDAHLEFKEAKNNFHFERLAKYCAALANEGGGSIVLGITDTRPRQVVGSTVFTDLERTKAGLVERLRLRIEAQEVQHPNGRVVVFTAPARPIGTPISVEGAYWMRAGEDLVPMTPDMLKHLRENPDGSSLAVLHQVVPQLGRRKVQVLLDELREEGRAKLEGARRWARWKVPKDTDKNGPGA